MTITTEQISFLMAALALGSAVFTAGMHVATLRRLGRDMDRVTADMAKVAALTVQVHSNKEGLDEVWKELRDYRDLPAKVENQAMELTRMRDSLHRANNLISRIMAKNGMMEEG